MNEKLPRGISRKRDGYVVRLSVNGKMEYIGAYLTLSDATTALSLARADIIRGTYKTLAQRRREQQLEDARRKAEAEEHTPVSVWVQQWLELLEVEVAKGELSRGTLRGYRSVLKNHVLPAIGDLPIGSVTPSDIEVMLERVRTPQMRGRALAVANRMFNVAVDRRFAGITASPVRAKAPKVKPKRLDAEHIATPSQVSALAKAMPDGFGLTVLLAAWCQARQGEVLGLQRRDFLNIESDGDALVRIERQWNQKAEPPAYTATKAKDTRLLSIPSALVPLIREHLEKRVGEAPESPVFESSRWDGKPMGHSNHNHMWRKAKAKVGMSAGFRFHDLRHTGLTIYAQQGATLAEIMARGGHTDVQVAMRYQHAALERDKSLVASMPVVV